MLLDPAFTPADQLDDGDGIPLGAALEQRIAALTRKPLLAGEDRFRCERFSCTLTAAACVARQDARKGTSRWTGPVHLGCGPATAGEPSPCAQGRAVRAKLIGGVAEETFAPAPQVAPVVELPAPAPAIEVTPAVAEVDDDEPAYLGDVVPHGEPPTPKSKPARKPRGAAAFDRAAPRRRRSPSVAAVVKAFLGDVEELIDRSSTEQFRRGVRGLR